MLNKIFKFPKSTLYISELIVAVLTLGWGIASTRHVDVTLKPQAEWVGYIFIIFSIWTLGCIVNENILDIKNRKSKANNNAK